MRRTLVWSVVLVLLAGVVLAPDTAAGGAALDKAAAKQKAKVAKVWIDLARYLQTRDLRTQALEALDWARALAPDARDLEKLTASVDELAGEGRVDASTEKRIQKANRDAAKAYDKLAGIFAKEQDDPRFAAYLVEAVGLDPSKKRLAKFGEAAKKGFLLVRSPNHPMVAYVSFPKAWKPGGDWPVLVGVDGAGANFRGCASRFAGQRGKRPFITISPHALSCTNAIKPEKFPGYDADTIAAWDGKRAAFDVPGLLAILDFLHEHFGAEKKIAITGFSGGGNLCYGFLLQHPDRVLCAAPACANFQPGLASGAKAPEDGGPPVHILTGENDPHRHLTHGKNPPGIEEQTDWAEKALADNGFERVERTMLDGVGHSACPREVWAFVDEVRGD